METSQREDQRRFPRINIELPAHAHVDETEIVQAQLVDLGNGGMQLRMNLADFERMRKSGEGQEEPNRFAIHIVARLAWLRPDEGGELRTGWKFILPEEDRPIG
jgi:hypothetical protein